MRIVQLTDLHLFSDPAEKLKGVPTDTTFKATWELALPFLTDDTTLVITGDLCHDELPATYQRLVGLLGPHAERALVLPGNHDDRESIRAHFRDNVDALEPFIHFCAVRNDWLLLGIDTQQTGSVEGVLETEQLEWLAHQLTRHSDLPCLLFLHHPPFDIGSEWLDPIKLQNDAALWQTLGLFQNVRGVFCGHIHSDVSTETHGIPCYATPSTGIQFKFGREQRFSTTLAPGFRVIETNSGQLSTTVHRLPKIEFIPVES